MPSHGVQKRPIAQVGRRVRGMDQSIDAEGGRVPNQPEKAVSFHLYFPTILQDDTTAILCSGDAYFCPCERLPL